MIPLADPTFANTIAGALAPAISVLALAAAGIAAKRIDRHRKASEEKIDDFQYETLNTLGRAERAIRGDLRNGINDRLARLEHGQIVILAAQTEIKTRLDELEIDPPSHLG